MSADGWFYYSAGMAILGVITIVERRSSPHEKILPPEGPEILMLIMFGFTLFVFGSLALNYLAPE
jgi:hypothetical protein